METSELIVFISAMAFFFTCFVICLCAYLRGE